MLQDEDDDDDDDEILQTAEEAVEETTNNDLLEGVEALKVNQQEPVKDFMEDLSSLTLSQDLLSDLQPSPVSDLAGLTIPSVQSPAEEKTPTATLIGLD